MHTSRDWKRITWTAPVLLLALAACEAATPAAPGVAESAITLPTPAYWSFAWDVIEPLRASHLATTPALTAHGADELDVFYVVPDPISSRGHVVHRRRDVSGNWGAADDLGGGDFMAGTGVAASYGSGRYVVAARHYDGSAGPYPIWVTFRTDNGGWSPWQDVGLPGYGQPAALVTGNGHLDVLGITVSGECYYRFSRDGAAWDAPQLIGSGLDPQSGPAGAPTYGDIIELLARTSSGQPRRYAGSTLGQSWFNETLPGTMVGTGAISSTFTPQVSFRIDAFYVGSDGALYQTTAGSSAWSTPTRLSDCVETTAPRAVSPEEGRIELLAGGMDGSVYHRSYGRFASTAPGPVPFCCGKYGSSCCPADSGHPSCSGDSIVCGSTNKCQQCGQFAGELCCPGDQCADDLTCSGGRCQSSEGCVFGNPCCVSGGFHYCSDDSRCVGASRTTPGVCE